MKKLFIAALLFVGVASFAQDADQKPAREPREKLTPEQRNEKHLQKLTTELNLDANQQVQVKQILAEKSAKAEKLKAERKDRKDSNVKPTIAEREAFKTQMIAEKDANDTKMKAILNADQYKKWTSIQEENKDKAREKMKEYKKENN
jgi:protein CpxP